MASTEQAHARRLALDDLPPEVLGRIVVWLPPCDLASLNGTSRLFRAAPPGGCSAVERALRERARARGHECALPPSLPAGVCTWTEELFLRERLLERVRVHASPVAMGACPGDVPSGFSAFVDAEGGLHTCGEEEEEDEDWEPTGEVRAHVATGHAKGLEVYVPTRVPSLFAVRVVAVAAGCAHLLALSDTGVVYGCGSNGYGQLGLGHTEEQRAFALVGLPVNQPVVCIVAGNVHSLALTAAGCAYSWGHNFYGQLGHGDTEERWEPTRIEALDGVRVGGVAAGGRHTLLLSAHGAVYSCGHGVHGQLGHGDQRDQHTPRRIEALAGVRAVHVSAGCAHSLVVDSEGAVYSFGLGRHGLLGHGDTHEQLTPRRIDSLAGVRIVHAWAGAGSSAVVCADGSVHTFGNNTNGELGLGVAAAAVPLPQRVHALAHTRVVRCAMGGHAALYVASDGSVYSCGAHTAALGLGLSAAGAPPEVRSVRTPTHIERLPCVHLEAGSA